MTTIEFNQEGKDVWAIRIPGEVASGEPCWTKIGELVWNSGRWWVELEDAFNEDANLLSGEQHDAIEAKIDELSAQNLPSTVLNKWTFEATITIGGVAEGGDFEAAVRAIRERLRNECPATNTGGASVKIWNRHRGVSRRVVVDLAN